MNDDALAWLDELPPDSGKTDSKSFSGRFPMVVAAALMRARTIAEKRDRGSARARLRSRGSGRWLVCHASCLRDPDGKLGNTALAIEPATESETAPIIVQAYELSPRETEITQADRAGSRHRRDRPASASLHPHGARLRQGGLREGRGL
jgi:hypothetical protein